MRQIILLTSLAIVLSACAISRLASEPADLIAPGRQLSQLTGLGWEISPPLTFDQVKELDPVKDLYPDNATAVWRWYQAMARQGDEIRYVRNNAGIGFAVFRNGILIDMTLPATF
jgi:hypothetical protein